MKLLRPQGVVRDDAGKVSEVVRLRTLRADERMAASAFAEVVADAETAREAYELPGWELGHVVGVIVAANVSHFAVVRVNGSSAFSVALIVVWVVVGVVLVLTARGRRLRRGTGRVAVVLLHDGVCAGCGYGLWGHYGEGGLVVCPECGAAWAKERIVRRHRFGARAEHDG